MASAHPAVAQAIELIMRQHACAAHTAAKILNARAVRSHTPMQLLAAQIVEESLTSTPAGQASSSLHGAAPTDLARATAVIMQESACDSASAGAEIRSRAAHHGLTAEEVASAIVRLGGRQPVR